MKKLLLLSLLAGLTLTLHAAKDSGELFREADQLYKDKKYDEIVTLFKQIDGFKNNDLWAVYLRAARYFSRMNDRAQAGKAAPLLDKAYKLAPKAEQKAEVLLNRAEMESNCGDRAKAKETLRSILTLKDATTRKQIDAIERLANFEPQYQTDMSKFEAVWREGLKYTEKDQQQRARVYYGITGRCNAYWIKAYDVRNRIYQEAAKDPLLTPDQRTEFAVNYTGSLPLAEAEIALRNLLQQKDINDNSRSRIWAALYERHMNNRAYLGKISHASLLQALICCEEAMKLPKADKNNWKNKQGAVWFEMGEYEKAMTAAKENGNHLLMANCLFRTGKYSEALSEYKEALKKMRPTKEICYKMARCQMAIGDYPEALKSLEDLKKSGGRFSEEVYLNDWISHVKTLIPASK